MRLVVLLILFITLMFSDGDPCQSRWHNNAYNVFQNRHILRFQFDRHSPNAWENYLTRTNLCGRKLIQSFVRKDDELRIRKICTRRGFRYRDNLCISSKRVKVYFVNSTLNNGHCHVHHLSYRSKYVIVACENVANICLPVHYHGQTFTPPPRGGKTCVPRA
ncbi:hypothetical protein E1301_Tti012943 [Triplophysa tibetana]|uniref:Uncharacterized protein n=1 Tax=Triplophysa tibetana TaxID=1572043 RepID=A0A5A9NU44_9TELE|nr:hypothetical protein E1301_Tti012943 [Triplophysa tibetana]